MAVRLWEGEDFAAFANAAVPGCFVFVGAEEDGNPSPAPHHHPQFQLKKKLNAGWCAIFLGIAGGPCFLRRGVIVLLFFIVFLILR